MADFLTRLCILGAAVSLALYFGLKHARRLALVSEFVSRIPRSSLAVFLVFAFVAMIHAQKQGTNAPPNGNVELIMENVELRNLSPLIENEQHHNSPLYILHSTLTNASYSYAMPSNAVRYSKWWLRGGYEDVLCKCRIETGKWRIV